MPRSPAICAAAAAAVSVSLALTATITMSALTGRVGAVHHTHAALARRALQVGDAQTAVRLDGVGVLAILGQQRDVDARRWPPAARRQTSRASRRQSPRRAAPPWRPAAPAWPPPRRGGVWKRLVKHGALHQKLVLLLRELARCSPRRGTARARAARRCRASRTACRTWA
jgi:hypothetical protein